MDCRENNRNLQVGITQTIFSRACLYRKDSQVGISVAISDFEFPYPMPDIYQKEIFVFPHHQL